MIRRQWRFFTLFAAAQLACFVIASFFATGPFQRGLILGSGVAIAFGMAGAFAVLLSGTAPLMMGEIAEQWTAQQLRPLTKHGWRLVNHFGLGSGDHDHVLVGPGGVVLLETKWSGTSWGLDEQDYFFQTALKQTRRNAAQLQGWADVVRHGKPRVEPVLVLWGQAAVRIVDVPVRRHQSGVLVVPGMQLRDWAERLGRDQLTEAQVDAVWTAISRHAEKRDAVERLKSPMPRSLQELAFGALGCVVAAATGFVLAAQVLEGTGSLRVSAVGGFVMLAVAELVRRKTRWGWAARAFQGGTLVVFLLGAALIARAYLQS